MSPLSLSVVFPRIVFIVALFASFASHAQRQKQAIKPRTGSSIIDDSTKNVYGPATTQWTTEKDLFENRPNYRPLDTTIVNYHRWTYVQRFNNYYKDLGPMGTALSSIFPQVPTGIGASSGYQVYEPYYTTEEPHYFDTKSPYTKMQIVWGGNGRAMTRIEFSRNINPRWNFGFNYRPILVEKQIQRRQKGDYQTISHYYDFYTTYKSKDSSYFLLFNFRRIRHRVKENGGVATPNDLSNENVVPNLTDAESEDYRRNIHLFHQYQIVQAFQLYHIADFTRQSNAFRDVPTNDPGTLYGKSFDNPYDGTRKDVTNITDESVLETSQNEVGIKGNASKFFYSAYYKFRTYNYSNYLMHTDYAPVAKTAGTESYIGGTISLKLDSVSEFRGSAETNFLEGPYRISGEIQTPWIEGSFKNALSKPGFMQQAYRGLHDYWNNVFDNISSTEAKGFLKWKQGAVQLWAGGTITLMNNYVYFKEITPVPSDRTGVIVASVAPTQYSGTLSTVSPEMKASFQFFRHVHLRPQFIFTKITANSADKALRIPEQFVNIQLAYENSLFKDHLQLHTGVDFHWQTSYYALAYTPTIQQFYVPANDTNTTINNYLSPEYPLVDIFLVGKMRRARFFVKYHNLTETLLGRNYSPTPWYPGQRSVIDFGFDFLLFD